MSTLTTPAQGVRAATRADALFAARLHAAALPHGFFARLGTGFLSAYYESFFASPHAVAFVAVVGSQPAGVLVGTLDNRGHYRWVLRHSAWRLAVLGVLALLVRPGELSLFARTRLGRYARAIARHRRNEMRPAVAPEPVRVAVLSHVAVSADARGSGVGAALVDAFLACAIAAGCEEARLVTLAGSSGAGDFYRRLGWTDDGNTVDRDGRALTRFSRRL